MGCLVWVTWNSHEATILDVNRSSATCVSSELRNRVAKSGRANQPLAADSPVAGFFSRLCGLAAEAQHSAASFIEATKPDGRVIGNVYANQASYGKAL
jgi:hypothetical protein